jgi:drug/metabolite transporter (DMT)-like permease
MPDRPATSAILLAFTAVYVIWGTTFLGNALVLPSIPPFFTGTVRFFIAGTAMYAWLRARERRPFQGLNLAGTAFCGVLLIGIGNGLVLWSQTGLPSGITALFIAVLPVLTVLFDWAFFSRRRPSPAAALGVTLGLAGVLVLSLNTHGFSGRVRPVHVLAVVAAEVGWALGTLLQRRYAPADRVANYTCLQMLVGCAFNLLLGLAGREWIGFVPSHVTAQSLLALLYLIVFGSLIAFNCYAFLVAHVSAQKITTYALVNPVIALALGALVLGERITPAALVAAVLVLLGVSLVLFPGALERLGLRALAAARAEN